MGTDSGWRVQGLGPKEKFSKHPLPTRNLGKGREGPLSLDQTPPAWEEMGKWGRPGRREEPQREKDGLFLLVILGAPWPPPATWPRPACPAISASPRQRNRLALAVRACTECPPQPLRSRSPWRAPAPPGSGGARVWQGLCSDPSGRPAPFPCGRGRLPGTAAALVRRRGRGHPTRLVIINPDTWRPHPPTPVTASPPSPGTSGLGLCKGDSEEPSKNKVPS